MKKLICALLLLTAAAAQAQQVERRVVVEHFTNSWCSICAGRNPGFYQNLSQFPQVLHLAIYPSAPYTGCPVNQYNKADQDARTSYYGVYGSTPRLAIQGKVVSSGTDYENSSIFSSELGNTSSFEMQLDI